MGFTPFKQSHLKDTCFVSSRQACGMPLELLERQTSSRANSPKPKQMLKVDKKQKTAIHSQRCKTKRQYGAGKVEAFLVPLTTKNIF